MPIPGPALALSALELGGLHAVDAIFNSSGPFRQIFWQTDPSLNEGSTPQTTQLTPPEVTVEEDHYDELEAPEHPVEQGAAITDHAYKRPAQLTMRLGWSEAGQQGFSIVPQLGDTDFLNRIYATLLQLQQDRTLISVMTARRFYNNLLIKSIELRTDEKTANVLLVRVRLAQIIIVTTQIISVPPLASQTRPQKTAADEQQGTQPLVQHGATGSFEPPTASSPNPFQSGASMGNALGTGTGSANEVPGGGGAMGWDTGFQGPASAPLPALPALDGSAVQF